MRGATLRRRGEAKRDDAAPVAVVRVVGIGASAMVSFSIGMQLDETAPAAAAGTIDVRKRASTSP